MNFKAISKIFSALTLSLVALSAHADADKGTVAALPVDGASITRDGDVINVALDLDFNSLRIKGDRAVLYTPYIVNGADSVALPPVGVYKRGRWYHYKRNSGLLGGPEATSLRYSKKLPAMDYTASVPYSPWMNGSHLAVKGETFGCCNSLLDTDILYLGLYEDIEFVPTFLYQTVADLVSVDDVKKTRALSGRAYIEFPVNQTVIYPHYRTNTLELNKIIATIDSVKADPDVTVDAIFIKGTASPEGPYDNNVRLARGRTDALIEYVRSLYNFPYGFIKSEYDPVDWEGLHDFLVNGPVGQAYANIADANLDVVLPNRYRILNIVDGSLPPYQRNQFIKDSYPAEYRWLLANVYPALRHSDYRIEYTIRQFTDAAEIAEIIKKDPSKLSLNEMLFLAGTYEPGSDEFNDVFEVAARMYPSDPRACLNVAVSAMQRGDLVTASRFLPEAGDSPEAVYARANYAFLSGDYQEADRLYREAAALLPEAREAYELFIAAGYPK